jgi:hypothetical protein
VTGFSGELVLQEEWWYRSVGYTCWMGGNPAIMARLIDACSFGMATFTADGVLGALAMRERNSSHAQQMLLTPRSLNSKYRLHTRSQKLLPHLQSVRTISVLRKEHPARRTYPWPNNASSLHLTHEPWDQPKIHMTQGANRRNPWSISDKMIESGCICCVNARCG